jgi:hypothetical protein
MKIYRDRRRCFDRFRMNAFWASETSRPSSFSAPPSLADRRVAARRGSRKRRRRAGNGTVTQQRLYQLIRQPRPIADRHFEIEFLDPGVEAFAFTFG